MSKICPVCQSPNSDEADICVVCGAALDDRGTLLTATATAPSDPESAPAPLTDAGPVVAEEPEQIAIHEERESGEPIVGEFFARFMPATDNAPQADVQQEPAQIDEPAPAPIVEAPLTPAGPITQLSEYDTLSTAPLAAEPEPVPDGSTAADAPTTMLPSPDMLQSLPVGALLDGRYIVRAVVQRSAGRNIYRATARNQQRCPQCGEVNKPGDTQCQRCGHALSGLPADGSYFITESFNRELLATDPEVHDRTLTHPHLMPLVDFFSYTPYGPPRFYSVAEGRQGVQLSQLGLPQPVAQVLEWGTQLSAALAYLHQQGVVSPGATPDNILIKEQEAVLTNLQTSHPAPEEGPEREREFAADISRLAATLYETMTGRFATVAGGGALLDESYPPELEAAFARALRPAKDALPLTDAEWGALLVAGRQALEAAVPGLLIRSGRLSNVGRIRELNEDSLAVVECQVMQESATASLGVYVVADGMGGHQGGEVASAVAIATVTESLVQQFVAPQFSIDSAPPDADGIKQRLTEAVQQANGRIHQQRASYHNDMGTTVVAAVIAGSHIYIANVGDSRAYIMTPAKEESGDPVFRQVTVDHSLVQRLVSTGQISEEEAKYHPYRNVIYNSMGEKPQVQIDIFTERAQPGTRLLICSDGLSTMLNDKVIGDVLAKHTDPQAVCDELVLQANNAGGVDNISLIVVYLEQPS